MILKETYTLSNGVEIPKLGLGTWFIETGTASRSGKTVQLTEARRSTLALLRGHPPGRIGRTLGTERECGTLGAAMATRTVYQRRRLVALSLVVIVAGTLVIALAYKRGGGRESRGPLPPKATRVLPPVDPLRYDASRRADYERHAALGLSHVHLRQDPGRRDGQRAAHASASARSIARVGRRHGLDPDTLAAIVMLESAGRPDARRERPERRRRPDADPRRDRPATCSACASTSRASERLTRGDRAAAASVGGAHAASAARVDERFDPREGRRRHRRYLDIAKAQAGGRADLAVESYHMGVGNLQRRSRALRRGRRALRAAVTSTRRPLRHTAAWRKLAVARRRLLDLLLARAAAREILRLYRSDPRRCARLAGAADAQGQRRGGAAPAGRRRRLRRRRRARRRATPRRDRARCRSRRCAGTGSASTPGWARWPAEIGTSAAATAGCAPRRSPCSLRSAAAMRRSRAARRADPHQHACATATTSSALARATPRRRRPSRCTRRARRSTSPACYRSSAQALRVAVHARPPGRARG